MGFQATRGGFNSGVVIELRKADDSLIASATTDANGNYYFSNATGTNSNSAKYNLTQLTANTQFKIVIPNVSGAGKQAVLGTNFLTNPNTGGVGQADARDSDGVLAGNNAEFLFTSGSLGANNHTYDFGFTGVTACSNSACVKTTVVKN